MWVFKTFLSFDPSNSLLRTYPRNIIWQLGRGVCANIGGSIIYDGKNWKQHRETGNQGNKVKVIPPLKKKKKMIPKPAASSERPLWNIKWEKKHLQNILDTQQVGVGVEIKWGKRKKKKNIGKVGVLFSVLFFFFFNFSPTPSTYIQFTFSSFHFFLLLGIFLISVGNVMFTPGKSENIRTLKYSHSQRNNL